MNLRDYLTVEFQVTQDGETVQSGTVETPAVEPHQEVPLAVPYTVPERGTCCLNLLYRLKEEAPFRSAGDLLGFDQFVLRREPVCIAGSRPETGKGISIRETEQANPFQITKEACPHDDAGGTKRGMNLIHVFDNGELRIAHFGDIGCPLNEEQKKALGHLDVVLVPVGGHFTMEPDGIEAMVEELQPRVVVPMHYRLGSLGLENIGTLDQFLSLCPPELIRQYPGSSLTLDGGTPHQVAVLQYVRSEKG